MAKKVGKPKQYERYIPTPDQWYPNYPGDTVRVRVSDVTTIWDTLAIRISVWGGDDCGMELDEYFTTHREKNKAYKHWCSLIESWQSISKQQLTDAGFVRA